MVTKSYVVVRAMPNGDRKRMNKIGGFCGSTYSSNHKEYDSRPTGTSKERLDLACEIARDWKRVGPWPDAQFIVEETA